MSYTGTRLFSVTSCVLWPLEYCFQKDTQSNWFDTANLTVFRGDHSPSRDYNLNEIAQRRSELKYKPLPLLLIKLTNSCSAITWTRAHSLLGWGYNIKINVEATLAMEEKIVVFPNLHGSMVFTSLKIHCFFSHLKRLWTFQRNQVCS